MSKVIWEVVIIRHDRDAEKLAAGYKAGDPTSVTFLDAAQRWLEMQRKASEPRLCMTCDHEFLLTDATGGAPAVFAMIYSEDPRTRHVTLSGICDHCAEKSDFELLTFVNDNLDHIGLGAKTLGFVGAPPSERTH